MSLARFGHTLPHCWSWSPHTSTPSVGWKPCGYLTGVDGPAATAAGPVTALPSQGDDKTFRRTPSWRKRFRPRDVHSINMLSGSAETLPAGFRVTSLVPLPPPSAPAKKMPPEGGSHPRPQGPLAVLLRPPGAHGERCASRRGRVLLIAMLNPRDP